jgi:hypothetical protein
LNRLLAQLRNSVRNSVLVPAGIFSHLEPAAFSAYAGFSTTLKRKMIWPIAGANLTSVKRASQ